MRSVRNQSRGCRDLEYDAEGPKHRLCSMLMHLRPRAGQLQDAKHMVRKEHLRLDSRVTTGRQGDRPGFRHIERSKIPEEAAARRTEAALAGTKHMPQQIYCCCFSVAQTAVPQGGAKERRWMKGGHLPKRPPPRDMQAQRAKALTLLVVFCHNRLGCVVLQALGNSLSYRLISPRVIVCGRVLLQSSRKVRKLHLVESSTSNKEC